VSLPRTARIPQKGENTPTKANPLTPCADLPHVFRGANGAENLPLEQAHEVRAAARASASLDHPVGEQEDALLGDFVAGDDPPPEEKADVSLRRQALSQALAVLPDRDRQVLAHRYGLGGIEAKTLDDVGLRLGLSRERIRQIERDSLRRLATLQMQAVADDDPGAEASDATRGRRRRERLAGEGDRTHPQSDGRLGTARNARSRPTLSSR
jgi:RNA polymerase sigma factor (sigma-70 family)